MSEFVAASLHVGRCLAWSLLLIVPLRCLALEPLPDSPGRERLLAGEVVLEEREEGRSRSGATVSALARAPVEAVWAVIVSCAEARAFVSGLRACEVLQDDGDYAVTHQVVDKGWMTPRLDYTFETRREPYRRMEFSLLEGNLKELHGSWTFQAFAEGLLIRHELVLAPQVPAPRWLVRRNLVRDLPGMLRCIRALAGGSLDTAQAENDRRACTFWPADQ